MHRALSSQRENDRPGLSALNATRVSSSWACSCIGWDTGAREVKLYWMKTSQAWPEGRWPESHWTCFDEDKPGRRSNSLRDTDIGSVHQIKDGGAGEQWAWNVTATFRGPRYPGITSGTMVSRQEAARLLGETYALMLRFYGLDHLSVQ